MGMTGTKPAKWARQWGKLPLYSSVNVCV